MSYSYEEIAEGILKSYAGAFPQIAKNGMAQLAKMFCTQKGLSTKRLDTDTIVNKILRTYMFEYDSSTHSLLNVYNLEKDAEYCINLNDPNCPLSSNYSNFMGDVRK